METEVGMIGNVNATIKYEKVFGKRQTRGEMGIGDGRIRSRRKLGEV